MSIAFWLEDNGTRVGRTYVSDGLIRVLQDLERKGILSPGDGQLGFMDDKKGAEVIPMLEKAIACLSDEGLDPENPTAGSEGNTKACLLLLRELAMKHPGATVVAWR